eukprot:COSAG04_NODE_27688_length_280_cov_2.508287_1_plen_22_part_01
MAVMRADLGGQLQSDGALRGSA